MNLRRRQFLRLMTLAAAAPSIPPFASAQSYPSRPVRLVVPYVAGGPVDAIARLVGNRLAEMWGHPVVIENKGGAGGNIGSHAVAQSAPDGHTMLIGSTYLATNPFVYPSLGYDPVIDFTPVSLLGIFPNLMVVPNSLPFTSVGEFVAYAKVNRGKVAFGSSGVGTSVHLSGELFKRMAGIDMIHVPYRGGAPAMNDLIPGRIHAYFGNLPAMLPQVQISAVRGLGVTSGTRSSFAPDIPTISESGVPGFDVSAWYALFLPAKCPPEIVTTIYNGVVAALAHPPVKQRLEELGATVKHSTPAELASYLKAEMEKWGPIIRELGIKAE
jgi:tripartite-type tricarboxylate transporter receptor subunit TctC